MGIGGPVRKYGQPPSNKLQPRVLGSDRQVDLTDPALHCTALLVVCSVMLWHIQNIDICLSALTDFTQHNDLLVDLMRKRAFITHGIQCIRYEVPVGSASRRFESDTVVPTFPVGTWHVSEYSPIHLGAMRRP